MLGINKTVVYDTALGECGVRYCFGECGVRYCSEEMWCTILPWVNVVYDTALEELWCTIVH